MRVSYRYESRSRVRHAEGRPRAFTLFRKMLDRCADGPAAYVREALNEPAGCLVVRGELQRVQTAMQAWPE